MTWYRSHTVVVEEAKDRSNERPQPRTSFSASRSVSSSASHSASPSPSSASSTDALRKSRGGSDAGRDVVEMAEMKDDGECECECE